MIILRDEDDGECGDDDDDGISWAIVQVVQIDCTRQIEFDSHT